MEEEIECLQLQLSEIEMLQSMYPNELSVDDPSVLSDVQKYIDGDTSEVPHQISVTLKIHMDEPKVKVVATQ